MNSQNMSIFSLVLQASWVVQLVMLALVVASVASWAAIFRKSSLLKRVRAFNDAFEQEFWSGTSLNDLYASAAQNAKRGGPMERIFASGMREYQKLRERRIGDVATLMDGTRRAMRASLQREMDEIEAGLPFLGSVGSVSPYVGLFGTLVARVPPKASAYRRRPSRSWATVGIAAATANASKPCSDTSATMPMVSAR